MYTHLVYGMESCVPVCSVGMCMYLLWAWLCTCIWILCVHVYKCAFLNVGRCV